MALGLTGGESGLFKYDAKDGQMKLGGQPLDKNMQWVMDFENAEVGWLSFAPFFDATHLVKVGNPWGANPQPKKKNADGSEERSPYAIGFKIMCYSKGIEGVKEFMSNTKKTKDGVEPLSEKYDEGLKDNPGKLPVVQLEDTIAIKETAGGTNYQPVFKIVKWVDRPAALGGTLTEAAAPVPAPKPAPAPAAKDEPEF